MRSTGSPPRCGWCSPPRPTWRPPQPGGNRSGAIWASAGGGLSAFCPGDTRLACLPCPNFIESKERFPLYREQRSNLIELRMLGEEVLPADRKDEIAGAVEALDRRLVALGGLPGRAPDAFPGDERTT